MKAKYLTPETETVTDIISGGVITESVVGEGFDLEDMELP